ncbi:ATP-binding protein [Longimicrobium sp.]|uniref:PAS domain-containing sensor histidine kinase n=1 Tax=Longimicrobium sp. TaxID=2029185 RepID=UPI003B3B635F
MTGREHDGAPGFAPQHAVPGAGARAGNADPLFDGPGEMRARCRATDWAATPMGPSAAWPPALRAAVRLMLATPVATCLWCLPAYTLIYNDTYRRILGAKHPALGRSGYQVWDELWPALEAQFEGVRAGGDAVYLDEALLTMERLEGGASEDAWFTYSLSALNDENGTCLAVYNLAVEITEKVYARQVVVRVTEQLQDQQVELELSNQQLQDNAVELEAANDELQAIAAELEERTAEAEAERARTLSVLESMSDAHFTMDGGFRILTMNRAMERSLNAPREAFVGRDFWEAFPGTVGTAVDTNYHRVVTDGVEVHWTQQYKDDFYDRDVEVDAYPTPDGGVAVFWREVTERMRLIKALGVERARLEEVFRVAPSFIVAYRGPEQVYEFVNEAYYQLVGHRELLGKPLLDALPEVRGQGFEELLERVRQTGEPWVGHETPAQLQRTPGGPLETRYLDMVFQPLAEADGTRTGVVAHGNDVTDQVLARREVERLLEESERARGEAEAARAEAEAANRGKSEFLAVMSHELRTPLNAIGGYAELLEMGIRGPVTPQQADDLRRIQNSQRHLLGLINEVLNYAKIETGSVHYDVADVPVREALAAAESLVAPQARAKGLALGVGDGAPSVTARADAEKLRQILVNLLSNAIKFTDRGGRVEISCQRLDGRVRVDVRDTGVGIPTEKLEAIFDPFVQVRADLTRPHEGTGLGLAISRDLARGMGGDLTVASSPGEGSTFTLTLPAA